VRFVVVALSCCTLGLAGCGRPDQSRSWSPVPVPALGAVVARVGEVPIFAAEVAGQAARTGKPPRQALDDLIELHLLAERLRDRWPPADEGSRALERELVVQRLVEREFEAHSRPEDMPDSVVRVIYDSAVASFVHPRVVEVAVLAVTPGKRALPSVREEAKRTVTELKAVVDTRKGKTAEDLQEAMAADKWHERHVQFFRFFQAGNKPYTAKFGAEVAKMKTPGETSPIIEDENGYYIARYLSERPPANQSFEDVKKELRDAYYPRWRQAKFLEFTEQAGARHAVEIHTGALTGQAPGS
jgi:parvulin-like peptidyl-prolyl cis-trans isomerase-like protein